MAQLKPQDDYMKTALRLPRELHTAIQEAAAASGRSMNAEIVARLQGSFSPMFQNEDLFKLQHRLEQVSTQLEKSDGLFSVVEAVLRDTLNRSRDDIIKDVESHLIKHSEPKDKQ